MFTAVGILNYGFLTNMFHDRDPIERFIDENKALIRRMYGEFQTPGSADSGTSRRKRSDTEFFMDTSDTSEESIFGGGWAIHSANITKRQADTIPNDQKDDPNKYDYLLLTRIVSHA